jgi:hypothetical protein
MVNSSVLADELNANVELKFIGVTSSMNLNATSLMNLMLMWN